MLNPFFVRDARYPVPRSASLPTEEQQRLQQYGHMLPGRNVHPSNLSSGSLSGTDRGVRILPGGNNVGMVAGMSRSMPMSRPGLGIPSSSMLNSGSVLSSGMPSNMNMHSGTASGQGNSMFRPRDAVHMVRVSLFAFVFFSSLLCFFHLLLQGMPSFYISSILVTSYEVLILSFLNKKAL